MTLVRGRKRVPLETPGGFSGNPGEVLRGDGTFAPVATGAGTGDVVGPAGATGDHVVTFNGGTGKLVKDSGVAIAAVVVTTDPRLSDARTPTAHTHPESDVTGLVTDLAARVTLAQALTVSSFRA